jgi:hypothetical protein
MREEFNLMTEITWPDELPQLLRLEGLSATKKGNVIRTSMDAGPAKARQRYTVSTKNFTGSILVTESQRKILENWYTNILGNGTLRFKMKDSQTLEFAEFRFLQDYTERSLDGLWEISLNLEKLNA